MQALKWQALLLLMVYPLMTLLTTFTRDDMASAFRSAALMVA
ncbi:hypothetical protein [Endozoicomonas sp.]